MPKGKSASATNHLGKKKTNSPFFLLEKHAVVWPTCWTYIGDKKKKLGFTSFTLFCLFVLVFGGRLMLYVLSLNRIVPSHQLKDTEKTGSF
jgi:hypothetical protein|uniref:Uncharacterized protein n=1 Tax=Zea mays TaxID=4577 RepID=B6UD89_MAIZE|nr:hypothetical protein [Zea mays]